MFYFMCYLVSMLFWIFACAYLAVFREGEINMKKEDVYGATICLVFWPLLPILFICAILHETYVEMRKAEANNVYQLHDRTGTKHDRSNVVAMKDKDLKVLLKGHRKGWIRLTKEEVITIRDELENRLVENQLLK